MKVSKKWLAELVQTKVSDEELVELFNQKTIGTKEVTADFIELDMKGYNRADLLSLRGVAYEVAALTDSKVLFDVLNDSDYIWVEKGLSQTKVEIAGEKLAEAQIVAKIENLKIGKSSPEWVKKLTDSGMRSVNNVVDITNLIMLEFGHPLHAFDAKNVKGDTIIVRYANKGEDITTLDGKKRLLEPSDIVLADDEKALDVAGVMGGAETEVVNETGTILLSASLFNPEMVRKTANRLGLHSEASKRFYHGLTKKRMLEALDGAIKLFEEIGGELTALTIVGDTQDQLTKVSLRLSKINQLIGETLSASEVEKYLKKLHFSLSEPVSDGNDTSWVVTVPYFRLDVELEEDLIEEVARIYGYEKITSHKAAAIEVARIDQSKFDFLRKLTETIVSLGLTEVSTYPYNSTKVLGALGWGQTNAQFLVRIKNPISKETEFLRQNLWVNLIEVIDQNARQGFKDIAIFELGKSYFMENGGKPAEGYKIAIALMNGSENPMAELNSLLQKLNQAMDLGLEFKAKDPDEMGKNLFHPVRNMEVFKDGKLIGGFSEVHKRVLDFFGIDKRVAVFEIVLTQFLD